MNERLSYLDYARVFVAFLVIYGHLLPVDDMQIRPYIYAFHMPFFFIVAGTVTTQHIKIEKYLKEKEYSKKCCYFSFFSEKS